MENYYEILGVAKDASKADIKKAFRKLAHQYHPDKKGGDEGKFKKINEAYQILSDDDKRSSYDRFGSAGPNMGGGGGPQGFDFSGFNNGQGFDFSDLFRQAGAGGAGGADFSDIFEGIFGGGRGGRRERRGRDISIDVEIPFKESIFGTERSMLVNKVSVCDTCTGSGAKPGTKKKKCATCEGRGMVRESRRSFVGTFTSEAECTVCHGTGEIPEEQCAVCRGLGVLKKAEEIRVKIPAGISDGEMIRMTGKGEAVPFGAAGDLYIKMHVERNAIFHREGESIVMNLPIKLTEALLGSTRPIQTLDGELTIKIPAGISHGEILRVRGKGVPLHSNHRGDLLVKIAVEMPTKLSRKAEKLIDELKNEGL